MSFSPMKDDHPLHRPGTIANDIHRDSKTGLASEPVRIRKYPNRRLYDTIRSRHLTHDGVIALVAEGRAVQVTDSRSGADITNAVLLQILIERDPEKLAVVPSELVLRAMRAEPAALATLATAGLRAWSAIGNANGNAAVASHTGSSQPSASPTNPNRPLHDNAASGSTPGGPGPSAAGGMALGGSQPMGSRALETVAGRANSASIGESPLRPKAKAKRTDDLA
ncbi:MAG: polyhydroxyalkanoate synthesis regulator DNA-binding domain-containing protein [Phycisphaerae bacterium]|nr:polyhydroxyalkanoate synthesis regulator DNA-binding domain-containing protein [Phycisphaerae bacterium]